MSAGILIPRRSVMRYVPNKHRYWRIRSSKIQGNHASDNFGLTEIEMRALSGGADQCSGGTAISSSDFSGSFAASNAFDNNTATIWSSVTGGGAHWIGYDFGSGNAVNVNEVFVTSRTDYLNSNVLTAFVESSDNGSTWTTQWQLTEMANWAAGETRTFTRPAFSDVRTKWRLLFQNNFVPNSTISFNELECRATVGGANLATSSNCATDSNFDGSHTVAQITDGNTATFWTSATTALPHWVTFTASSDMSLLEYVITARSDGTAYQLQPSLIMLQHSLDGKTWHDLKLSGYPTSSAGVVQTFQYAYPGGLAYIAA